MKKLLVHYLFIAAIAVSCKKDQEPQIEQESNCLELSFTTNPTVSFKSSSEAQYASVLLDIIDIDGTAVCKSEKVEVHQFGDSWLSKPIALKTGNYELTSFSVLDTAGNIVLATPTAGSKKAYLVSTPLAIHFSITKDITTKLTPEVISTHESSPEEFGYMNASFQIVETFDFLTGVLAYDAATDNHQLTDASISVSSNSTILYSGDLSAATEKITVPLSQSIYTIEITKDGYADFISELSADSLKTFFDSPLTVVLSEKKTELTKGLVAYYPFDGNANDLSENENNGTVHGAAQTTDRHGNENSAYYFDGNDDIAVNSTASNAITGAISISAWFKTNDTRFQAGIVCKMPSAGDRRGYRVCLQEQKLRSDLNFDHSTKVMSIRGTADKVTDNTWHHVLVVYDGYIHKLYLDGELASENAYTKGMQADNSKLYFGRDIGSSDRYYKGAIDEVRIYNRALSEAEIEELAKQ